MTAETRPPRRRRIFNRRSWWARPDGRRLQAELTTFRAVMDSRAAETPGPAWKQQAEALLKKAEGIQNDEAWACFLGAVRLAVPGLGGAGVRAEALVLLAEAREKLSGWRRQAVIDLLEHGTEDHVVLQEAMLVRDEGVRNVHRKGRLLRSNVVLLASAAGLAAVALVVLALTLPIELGASADDAPARLWLYAFLLGAVGGGASALQRMTSRGTRGRIPELREYALGVLVLPLTGAAAGTAAVPLAIAGVIPSDPGVAATLSVAFAAGFSERLILRATDAGPGSGKSSS